LMVNLPERLEVDRYLITKLFFIFDRHLNSAEIFARVAWRNFHFGEGVDFRAGLRIAGISPEDMNKWRNFLYNLSGLRDPL
jgi:Cu2+-containing amine oxidase